MPLEICLSGACGSGPLSKSNPLVTSTGKKDGLSEAQGTLPCFGPFEPQQLSKAERYDPITMISDNEVAD